MKKLIVGLLTLLIAGNIGLYIYYKSTMDNNRDMISNLQQNNKTKSTEIAKLGDIIEKQNLDLKNKEKVINAINKVNEKLKKELNKKGSDVGGRRIKVSITSYIANCSEGCSGKTATGYDVSNTVYYKGYRIIAVDTSIIPLYSLVKIEINHKSFLAIAIDKGGGINGYKIDFLVSSYKQAIQFGVRKANVTILKEGKRK